MQGPIIGSQDAHNQGFSGVSNVFLGKNGMNYFFYNSKNYISLQNDRENWYFSSGLYHEKCMRFIF